MISSCSNLCLSMYLSLLVVIIGIKLGLVYDLDCLLLTPKLVALCVCKAVPTPWDFIFKNEGRFILEDSSDDLLSSGKFIWYLSADLFKRVFILVWDVYRRWFKIWGLFSLSALYISISSPIDNSLSYSFLLLFIFEL